MPSNNALHELSSHGIPVEKITLLPNPLPTEKKLPMISLRNLPNTENIICSVGRLSMEKSYEVCVKTIALVSSTIPDICFVIVGDGPERTELEELAGELGIEKNILFLGKVPHVELLNSDLFMRSKLFLTASTTETQ